MGVDFFLYYLRDKMNYFNYYNPFLSFLKPAAISDYPPKSITLPNEG